MGANHEASAIESAEDRRQLRRAILASTIGTAIEWYDFFLYSTVTGLVFARLYFPQADPSVGTIEAFGVYTVGFIARPIGAAIFGHYGDRLGRKAALVVTLLLMGIRDFSGRARPRLSIHRYLGCGPADGPALHSGNWRGRGVGWIGASGNGMGAVEPASRFHYFLAAVRRTGRPVSGKSRCSRVQQDVRRAIPDVGLARSFPV